MAVNRPQSVGRYTKDIVYARLAPGVLKELEGRNPRDERGYRKSKHHQWLTHDVGHTALAQHLYAVIGFMHGDDDFPGPINLGNPNEVTVRELAETIHRTYPPSDGR